MALNKQPLTINFAQGLDLKTDPYQVTPGKFLQLQNSVFDKGGLLQKRNGYAALPALPDATSNFLTTFNGNLLAIGENFNAYSEGSGIWFTKSPLVASQLTTLPVIHSNSNQIQAESVVASNGLVCTVYTENVPANAHKYVITDGTTGQNIIPPTIIVPTLGTLSGTVRVFLLGNHFVLVCTVLIGSNYHLQYFPISTIDPTQVGTFVNLSSLYTPSATVSFDGYVAVDSLYLAWNGADVGGAVRMTRLDSNLFHHNTVVFRGHAATLMSVYSDTTSSTPVTYAAFYDSATQDAYILAVNTALNTVLVPTQIINNEVVDNITIAAQNGACEVFYEVDNDYTYDSGIATHYINQLAVTQGGTVGPTTVCVRSVGLASKAAIIDGIAYFLTIYQSDFQPSYFLVRSNGKVISQLAYSNGSQYYVLGLPQISVSGKTARVSFLIKDFIQSVNKSQGVANAAGIYTQTGINLATFDIMEPVRTSAEIGNNINIPSGFLVGYDGYEATENGFFLWPDYLEATVSPTGGNISNQQYYYVATYEWTDNQGNIFRSAPSIPLSVDVVSGTTNMVTVNVPTLRLTYKTTNPAKIVLYRWSLAQQVYYQVTSITNPILNDPTVDSIAITDTLADADILGNSILYTTGGVLENIAAPPSDTIALFQSRLFLVDSEDKNLLWYSKQVIEATPVEMSDLLTIYVAPTISAQGNTGVITALSSMDDKLIVFKKDAIYYITGTGPDNTGANSQFSDPIFITSTVGCANQKSVVFMPNGLMFQSDKGIWLLGRDLSTNYIGAPVETYTQTATVQSAVNVPGTNQIRFTMDSGITLMYDYYYGQWGTFVNVPAISSTLYTGFHTYINSFGQVFKESIGKYLDGAKPVLMNFTTSWFNLAGLQGYQRAYYFYLLGTYASPHKLTVGVAYDYNSCPAQTSVIAPDNYSPPWGGLAQWGSSPEWGGGGNIEQWRVFFVRQKCQSIQLTITESFDGSIGQHSVSGLTVLGTEAGAGLTISGLDIVLGMKSGYPRIKPARSVG